MTKQEQQLEAIFGKPEPETRITEYRAEDFIGAARSYAGQGICSICHEKAAQWQTQRGAVLVALCNDCLNS